MFLIKNLFSIIQFDSSSWMLDYEWNLGLYYLKFFLFTSLILLVKCNRLITSEIQDYILEFLSVVQLDLLLKYNCFIGSEGLYFSNRYFLSVFFFIRYNSWAVSFMLAEWHPQGYLRLPVSYSHPRDQRCLGPQWPTTRKAGGEEWPHAWRFLPLFPLPWPCSSFGAKLRPWGKFLPLKNWKHRKIHRQPLYSRFPEIFWPFNSSILYGTGQSTLRKLKINWKRRDLRYVVLSFCLLVLLILRVWRLK